MAKKTSTDLTSLGVNNALIFRSDFNGCDISRMLEQPKSFSYSSKDYGAFFLFI